MRQETVSIGVDIGGTFTDIVLFIEGDRSTVTWTKAPSTPKNLVRGVLDAVEKGLSRIGHDPSRVAQFLHATTVGTNAVLEDKGARLGILMTEGFEDVLEVGRQRRSQLYEVFLEPETPAFLCPRNRRLGVRERVAYTGEVLVELNEGQLREALARLQAKDVEALAVCYLFSFQNPVHERRTQEILASELPGMAVSLSHEINPVFREYERLCVTAFDAYLRPVMESYLGELDASLRDKGIGATVQTMKSRGGMASTEGALQRPVNTMLSGPAAGVIGARFVASTAGFPDVITLDMGGTSADIAVVREGKPLTSTRGGIRGYPLNIPMVDVQTIGAGGGSIAWLDAARGLRVGPRSAGSDPGPACYGAGGEEPTVTDASIVAGYLDAEYFLGGEQRLDYDAAWRAVEKIARPLGLDVPEAALGIHRIVNAKMADAIRLASVKRGYDIRQFSLMVFGGAGPVNGAPLADELGMSRCVVPRSPGVLSALGLLVSDVEYDNAQTFLQPVTSADNARANEILQRLHETGMKQMSADGYAAEEITVRFSADMRYIGQSTELEVQIDSPLLPDHLPRIREGFDREHERVYGYSPPGTPVEFVNLRSVHIRSPQMSIQEALRLDTKARPNTAAPKQVRDCYFASGKQATAVYDRDAIPLSVQIEGPAIIQQEDTTTVVYPRHRCSLDAFGNILIERS